MTLFQSTRPRGARPQAVMRVIDMLPVSIHAPAWGATASPVLPSSSRHRFNPRARVGRDNVNRQGVLDTLLVSIHAPAWGATRPAYSVPGNMACFNPRARVGRDEEQLKIYVYEYFVSIHAPAWGATGLRNRICRRHWRFNPRARVGRDSHGAGLLQLVARVSIHAPAWGATRLTRTAYASLNRFNPRARVGRDAGIVMDPFRVMEFQSTRPRGARRAARFRRSAAWWVSIHAPAWGATTIAPVSPTSARVFQSTRPRGARLWCAEGCPRQHSFNPRARVGRDGCAPTDRHAFRNRFNPRARVGRDRSCWPNACLRSTFQSTRPRGARHGPAHKQGQGADVSIHAPAWGATVTVGSHLVSIHVSIHAPAWGATCVSHWNLPYDSSFQSTRPRGARPFNHC